MDFAGKWTASPRWRQVPAERIAVRPGGSWRIGLERGIQGWMMIETTAGRRNNTICPGTKKLLLNFENEAYVNSIS